MSKRSMDLGSDSHGCHDRLFCQKGIGETLLSHLAGVEFEK